MFALRDVHHARRPTFELRERQWSPRTRSHKAVTAAPTCDAPYHHGNQKNNAPSHIIIIIIVSANLDWIPQRRASAVCLQCWISSRLAATPYGIEEPPLRRTIRRRQACARAVLSDR